MFSFHIISDFNLWFASFMQKAESLFVFPQNRKTKILPEQPNKECLNISKEWHKSIHNAAHVDPIQ